MTDRTDMEKNLINPHKEPDRQFYLDLLDPDRQTEYEILHLRTVMMLLKKWYINRRKVAIREKQEKIDEFRSGELTAEAYREIIALNGEIKRIRGEIDGYRSFFEEPYFARMDLVDDKEGYNSYYIGKHGDINLEVVDWRAPLARKYYQKSQIAFSINEYNYKIILRRAIRAAKGKFIDFKNEYLNLRDFLSREEIAGRGEEVIFDPYLKEILKEKKEQTGISDIIETIQERQYEIITRPEEESFVLQGCAGSGKTMIMLHRLSYLMYNNENLTPADVLVITPSDSFNGFIEELSQVLELEKVKTVTIDGYFSRLLKNAGFDMAGNFLPVEDVPEEYLAYIYSDRYPKDVKKQLHRIFESVTDLFFSPECAPFLRSVQEDLDRQEEMYTVLRNAGVRIRRSVLGEIKEKPEGGLYYTKPFRELMNHVSVIREFLSLCTGGTIGEGDGRFYQEIIAFSRSLDYVVKKQEAVLAEAAGNLAILRTGVEAEISDLSRYRITRGGKEVETYADRIAKRKELLREIEKNQTNLERIGDCFTGLMEFAAVLSGNRDYVRIGKCSTTADLVKFFYKEIVRKDKNAYGVGKGLYRCDAYSICLILHLIGFRLGPRYGLIILDEGQDISGSEYILLKEINEDAAFNVYGDLQQNITPFRGLKSWDGIVSGSVYVLDRNYRNTNQIVSFVAEQLDLHMLPIGFDGPAVTQIDRRGIGGFFSDKNGMKAVIVREEELESYRRKSYNVIRDTGKLSRSRINLMTVFESKGLEFTSVVVVPDGMTVNEKYIAYTRALKELAVTGPSRGGRNEK